MNESEFNMSSSSADDFETNAMDKLMQTAKYLGLNIPRNSFATQNQYHEEITFVEMAIINKYLYGCYTKQHSEMIIETYGQIDLDNRIRFGNSFDITSSYWFSGSFLDITDDTFIFQTKMHVDTRNELSISLNISSKNGGDADYFDSVFKKLLSVSFNNSEFKGKCIKIKLRESRFNGIEIIKINETTNKLILNDIQQKFLDHFVSRVSRGSSVRYLLNGEPGSGKTETIREIARKLIPNVTFIIPDFETTDDLTSILEACEIFENSVIIMDDIDLYLGSREHGSYSTLLGQFLSFFDGVKQRKVSLLASTNDKGLVDKAAERPGRFNFTLDYTYLNEEQIVKVCEIHLPTEWCIPQVYEALTGNINGKKANITGAFIANLADNIREMSEGDENWGVSDTVSLIEESYKGFYSSQVEKQKNIGFKA